MTLQNILQAFEQTNQLGQSIALATLVKAQGSTYRRPGARMLMTSQGQMVGSLSGGCLEGDVYEQAQEVMASGKPIVVQYDTMSDEDIIWGLGLGCNGIVQILIERVEEESPFNPLAFLAKCIKCRQLGVLATVFYVEGQLKAQVGSRLMVYPDRTINTNIADADLVAQISDDSLPALDNKHSTIKAYPLATGQAEVFIEVIQPPVPLMIFGAGHDAVPLVRLAQELGWYVTVVDSRAGDSTKERFPNAHEVILGRPETIGDRIQLDNHTMAVVMTHNYLHDLELLKILLSSSVKYLGILGPKNRTEKLLQDLKEQGTIPTEQQLQRLYSPVGLAIGADTPEEIALSIVAEIQAVLAHRSGGSLRNQPGPIHDRGMV
ncbi:MAG TPA: xanthine dehydrogenase [Cyanobacteria bacterium UBA8803]|nr:xanthine dehydrogenase [Cyanobacteria bacterium UBA9273]HBL57473.1 xanthine dehydrogenase [Cyanobacteria bacterium UBA8803]